METMEYLKRNLLCILAVIMPFIGIAIQLVLLAPVFYNWLGGGIKMVPEEEYDQEIAKEQLKMEEPQSSSSPPTAEAEPEKPAKMIVKVKKRKKYTYL